MRTVLIIGANRGIGLQLIRTFADNGWRTIGSIRPQTAAEDDPSVSELKDTNSEIIEIDYTQESTIIAAAEKLRDTKLDVLVNCGGLKPRPLEWDAHEEEDLMERFQVMPVGYFLASKHFIKHLSVGAGGKIVNISSASASTGNPDHDGESVGYRMAKAAVNSQTRTLAIDFKNAGIPVKTIAIAPGFIQTRLTGYRGTVNIKESSNGMYQLIDKLTPEMSGLYYEWTRRQLP